MRLASYLKYLYLAYFSKPAGQRVLYRAIRRGRVSRILEIGIGDPARTLRMIRLAQSVAGGEAVRYAAIDLFDARPAGCSPKLSIKDAHRVFKPTEARIQLIPGDPAGALARVANSLPNVGVVLIGADQSDASLVDAWFYIPRMLHQDSVVYRERIEDDGTATLTPLARDEIDRRAASSRRRAA